MKNRRSFKPEEKAKIVLEILSGEQTLTEIGAKYGVHTNQLQRWKKQFLENAAAAFEKENSEESKELKKMEEEKEALLMKVGQLTVEVDWLKKKSGIK
jgi:putative transposase